MSQAGANTIHSIETVELGKNLAIQPESGLPHFSREVLGECPEGAKQPHIPPAPTDDEHDRMSHSWLDSVDSPRSKRVAIPCKGSDASGRGPQQPRSAQSPEQEQQTDFTACQYNQRQSKTNVLPIDVTNSTDDSIAAPRSLQSTATTGDPIPQELRMAGFSIPAPFNTKRENQDREPGFDNVQNDLLIKQQIDNRDHYSPNEDPQHSTSRVCVVHQSPPVDVSRKQSKIKHNRSKRSTRSHPVLSPGFTIKDYLELAAFEADQKVAELETRIRDMQIDYQNEMTGISNDKHVLRQRLVHSEDHVRMLESTIEKNVQKQKEREMTVVRMKKFVDGLGNDFDVMKKGATAMNHQIVAITKECSDREQMQLDLCRTVSHSAERTTKVRIHTLQALHEARAEIDDYRLKNQYLEQQLSERVGLLSEERDRRSLLERRLAGSSTAANDELQRSLKLYHEKELDELYLVQANVDQHRNDSTKLTERVEDTMVFMQDLATRESLNSRDLSSMRVNIEVNQPREASTVPSGPLHSLIESGLEDLKSLRACVEQHEVDVKQVAHYQVIIATLTEQAKASSIRIADHETELQSARDNDAKLKESNLTLHTRLTCLQDKLILYEDSAEQCRELRSALNYNALTLENSKADLQEKAEHLCKAQSENVSLRVQVKALQEQAQQAEDAISEHARQADQLRQKHAANQQTLRSEFELQETNFITQRLAEKDNEIRRIVTERDGIAMELQEMAELRTEIECKLSEVQQQVIWKKSSEIEKLSLLTESQRTEMEKLRCLLPDREELIDGNSSARSQCNAEKSYCQQATQTESPEEISTEVMILQQQVENLQYDLAQAHMKSDVADAALRTAREEHKAGLKQLRDSCQQTVIDDGIKVQQQILALQNTLATAQDELQAEVRKDQEFRANVEASWEIELQAHREQIASMRTPTARETVQRIGYTRTTGTNTGEWLPELHKQLIESNRQGPAAAIRLEVSECQSQPQCPKSDTKASQRKDFPSDITGKSVSHPARKEVEGSASNNIYSIPFPAPELLLRPLSRAGLTQEQIELDVSCLTTSTSQPVSEAVLEVADAQETMRQLPQAIPSDIPSSSVVDDDIAVVDQAQVVEETQKSNFPSFASFAAMVDLTNVPRSTSSLSELTIPSTDSVNDPDADESQDLRSTVDKEDYTFRKQHPQANSASKRSNVSGETSAAMRGQTPASKEVWTAVHTPDTRICTDGHSTHSRSQTRNHGGLSSSPEFMNATPNHRKYSIPGSQKYSGPVSASQNAHQPRTPSHATSDPRLIGRALPFPGVTKRKSTSQIIEGYEQEREKRLAVGKSENMADINRYSFRDRTSSISSTFSKPEPIRSMPKGLRGSKAASQLPAVGGEGSLNHPRVKKMSKSQLVILRHRASANFSQTTILAHVSERSSIAINSPSEVIRNMPCLSVSIDQYIPARQKVLC
nr:hypothetical protein CFP56_53659 [Quercus suber]